MPYDSARSMPDAVKQLPAHAGKIWRSAFNAAHADQGEEAAFKIAWAAVKKAGYQKNERTGKWVKRGNRA